MLSPSTKKKLLEYRFFQFWVLIHAGESEEHVIFAGTHYQAIKQAIEEYKEQTKLVLDRTLIFQIAIAEKLLSSGWVSYSNFGKEYGIFDETGDAIIFRFGDYYKKAFDRMKYFIESKADT